MANFLARRACQNLFRTRLVSTFALPARHQRSIHVTSVVQKKKAAASSSSIFEDDLFGDDFAGAEDDLFENVDATSKSQSTSPSEPPPSEETTAKSSLKSRAKKVKLTPAERHKRFEAYMAYVTPRLGRKPEVSNPRVKKRSLFTLIQLAQSEEELGRVMELLPKWKESGGEVLPHFAEAFVRRCQELACPTLALGVFGHYSKYQLTLTLPAAQWLLHALHMQYPIEQLMIATSLYPVYHLPPISSDLASAAMVASACYKHGSAQSIRLAEELKPHVERLLVQQKKVRKRLEATTGKNEEKAKTEKKEKKKKKKKDGAAVKAETKTDLSQGDKREARKKLKWVAYSLHSVNKACEKQTGKAYVNPDLVPSALRLEVVGPLLAASTVRPPTPEFHAFVGQGGKSTSAAKAKEG